MALLLPALLGLAGAVLIVLHAVGDAWSFVRGRPQRLCPGPAIPRSPRALLALVYRVRCGYDLCGQRADAHGCIGCPECGRMLRNRRALLRTARSMQPAGIGALLLLAAALAFRFPPIAGTTLVAMTPTNVLLGGEGVLGVGTPPDVREEIRRRALDHQLDEMQITRFVQLLVDDLRSDSLLGNATDAIEQLAIFGSYDDAPLIAALQSDDAQQRYLAADVLSSLPRDGPPPAALIQIMVDALRSDDVRWNALDAESYLSAHLRDARTVLIEALRSDDAQQRSAAMELVRQDYTTDPPPADAGDPDGILATLLRASCDDLRRGRGRGAAGRGFRFLVRYAAIAEPMLVEGMTSTDPRQRMLCAAVAGCAASMRLMEQAAPILVEHLADNSIEDDAFVAARALGGFGRDVVPLLVPLPRASGVPDEQQRQALEYIIRRLTTNDSLARLRRDLPAARLSSVRDDVVGCDIEYLRMPQFP